MASPLFRRIWYSLIKFLFLEFLQSFPPRPRGPPSPLSRPGDSGARNPCGTAIPAISVISAICFSSY